MVNAPINVSTFPTDEDGVVTDINQNINQEYYEWLLEQHNYFPDCAFHKVSHPVNLHVTTLAGTSFLFSFGFFFFFLSFRIVLYICASHLLCIAQFVHIDNHKNSVVGGKHASIHKCACICTSQDRIKKRRKFYGIWLSLKQFEVGNFIT